MRLFLYLASLLAGVYAIRFMLSLLIMNVLFSLNIPLSGPHTPLQLALLYFAGYLPFVFPAIRAFIWFKLKRIAAPESFRGLPYGIVCVAAAFVALVVIGYAILAIAFSGSGLSGVPLGMALMLCGVVLAVSMPFVEIRDWLALFRARRRPSVPQGTSQETHSK